MKKRPSIHDLAKELGVSATAISFVINGKAEEKGISEGLQRKILDYIDTVGYQPNIVAQSLRTGKTGIIGMLVEDIADPFFSHIARGVEEKLSNYGYKVFIVSTENDTGKTKTLLKVFRDRQVDGYIIAPPPGIEKELIELMEVGMPVILFDRNFPEVNTNNVIINNSEAVHDAVAHLWGNGFSYIGFVTLASCQFQMQERLKGYKSGIEEIGQQQFILEVAYNSPAKTTGQKVKDSLNKNQRLDALLFATNYLTVAGLEAINEVESNIPEDLAIISFDDSPTFRLTTPKITAVAQPIENIAEAVVERLMTCLYDPAANTKTETIVLKTELIVRNSSVRKGKKNAVL